MRVRSLAAALATTLALTACGGSTPEATVASAIDSRLDSGFSFNVAFSDLGTMPADARPLLGTEEGFLRGAIRPDGDNPGLVAEFGPGNGLFGLTFVDESLFLRVDLAGLSQLGDEMGEPFPFEPPSPSDLAELGAFLPPNIVALASSFMAGEWVGLTGMNEEALSSLEPLAGMLGVPIPDVQDTDEHAERLAEIAESHGLGSAEAIVERYVIVQGEGPTYDLVIQARDLATALDNYMREAEAEGLVPGGIGGNVDTPEPSETPEQVEGISVTINRNRLEAVHLHVATVAGSFGETFDGPGDNHPGDATVTATLSDVGDTLRAPAGAVTVEFSELAVLFSMLGGFMSQFEDLGTL